MMGAYLPPLASKILTILCQQPSQSLRSGRKVPTGQLLILHKRTQNACTYAGQLQSNKGDKFFVEGCPQ